MKSGCISCYRMNKTIFRVFPSPSTDITATAAATFFYPGEMWLTKIPWPWRFNIPPWYASLNLKISSVVLSCKKKLLTDAWFFYCLTSHASEPNHAFSTRKINLVTRDYTCHQVSLWENWRLYFSLLRDPLQTSVQHEAITETFQRPAGLKLWYTWVFQGQGKRWCETVQKKMRLVVVIGAGSA